MTTVRLGLSIVLFVLLHFHLYWAGFWLFLVTAGTDWLDGFWARRYGQITILGRMLDPFVDKVVICGTYIFLAADPVPASWPGWPCWCWGTNCWSPRYEVSWNSRGPIFRVHLRQAQIHFAMRGSRSQFVLVELRSEPRTAGKQRRSRDRHRPTVGAMVTVISIWSMIAMTIYSGYAYVLAASN